MNLPRARFFRTDNLRDRQTVITKLTVVLINLRICLRNSCMNVCGQCCVLTVTCVLV